jgi:hypothetical protein
MRPGPRLALGQRAAVRPDDRGAARRQRRDVALGRGRVPHHVVHRRRQQQRPVGRQQHRRGEVVGDAERRLGDQVGGRGRDDHEVAAAREPDMADLVLVGQREKVGEDALARQRRHRERRHEFLRRAGQDAAHRRPALAQAADKLERLVRRDPAGDHEQDLLALDHGRRRALT